jgi:hypothetical protein
MAPHLYGNAVKVHPGQQIIETSYGGLVDEPLAYRIKYHL